MGSSQTTQQQQSTTPWAPQAAALQTTFNQAPAALAQSQAAQSLAPTNYTATDDPALLASLNAASHYGNSTSTAGALANGNSAATAGASGISGSLSGLTGYDPSKANNPSSLIQTAQQYVQGQNIPAQVQAAMLQGEQTARDVTLPGIQQDAAISGNTDSSRNGIAQGLVERGLGEQAADLSNSLTGQAFGQGLSLASSNANANNQAELSALSDMGAIGTGGLNAGTNAATNAINDQGTLYGIGENAGQGLTENAQAALTNQLQRYQAGISDPYAPLQQYMNLVGGMMYGSNSSGTSTTQSDPSALSVIGGLMGAGGSLASGLGKMGFMPFSDRRLKHDIKRVGTLDNGLPVYTFKYTFDASGITHIGVMAQEAEELHPDAIGERFGFKTVDYSAL